jgi:alkylhydroperoxidase family enzyme
MKRTTLVEYDDASPEIQAIYDEFMEITGAQKPLNVLLALGNNENALRAVWSLLHSILLQGDIPALLKELILFRISIKAGNQYCTSLHAHSACSLEPSLSYEDLVALSEGEANAKLPESFQVALDVVSRAALQSKSMADEDFDFEEQLRDAGFSESEIDELLAIGFMGVSLNTMTDSYDIPREEFELEGA